MGGAGGDGNLRSSDSGRASIHRSWCALAVLVLGSVVVGAAPVGPVPGGAATPPGAWAAVGNLAAVAHRLPSGALVAATITGGDRRAHDAGQPSCTFNGATELVPGVTPGAAISLACTGWPAFDQVVATEFSPLLITTSSSDEIDPNVQTFVTDGSGNLSGTFIVPDPFSAPDPAAACPPTPTQIAEGYLRCGIALADAIGNGTAAALDYAGVVIPSPTVTALGPPPPANATAAGIASTPYGLGYWLAWSDGTVTDYGDALDFGDASTVALNEPITHIVATADGLGYWLVAADGGVFTFGDAAFYGSMGGTRLNKPVVDLAPTPDGSGYWLVASDGGIFSFGDASFDGSMAGTPLNQPVVGMAADTATGGYWLVAADGGIFAFDAPYLGSTGNLLLDRPVVGMAAVPGGAGYLFVASDGGVFTYGDARFSGSTGGMTLAAPIVGIALDPLTLGYWLAGADGGVFAFDAPFDGAG
jgi:hypothetical protein